MNNHVIPNEVRNLSKHQILIIIDFLALTRFPVASLLEMTQVRDS